MFSLFANRRISQQSTAERVSAKSKSDQTPLPLIKLPSCYLLEPLSTGGTNAAYMAIREHPRLAARGTRWTNKFALPHDARAASDRAGLQPPAALPDRQAPHQRLAFTQRTVNHRRNIMVTSIVQHTPTFRRIDICKRRRISR